MLVNRDKARARGGTHWYPISFLYVEDEVLDECHLVQGEDNLETGGRHLCQHEDKDRSGIHL